MSGVRSQLPCQLETTVRGGGGGQRAPKDAEHFLSRTQRQRQWYGCGGTRAGRWESGGRGTCRAGDTVAAARAPGRFRSWGAGVGGGLRVSRSQPGTASPPPPLHLTFHAKPGPLLRARLRPPRQRRRGGDAGGCRRPRARPPVLEGTFRGLLATTGCLVRPFPSGTSAEQGQGPSHCRPLRPRPWLCASVPVHLAKNQPQLPPPGPGLQVHRMHRPRRPRRPGMRRTQSATGPSRLPTATRAPVLLKT